MQCIHLVKVEGIPVSVHTYGEWTITPYVDWLKANSITRYRRSGWQDLTMKFRFERIEDAMAFKLRWCE